VFSLKRPGCAIRSISLQKVSASAFELAYTASTWSFLRAHLIITPCPLISTIMLTFYSDSHRLHHGTELKDGVLKPCVEMPSRADTILARVRKTALGEVLGPEDYPASAYSPVHSERYIHFLQQAWSNWQAMGRTHDALPLIWPVRDLRSDIEPDHIDGKLGFYAMDAGVPITSGTWEAVRISANLALSGMNAIAAGAPSAFALCRPPGHHAAAEYMGGYCYLNNAAIAAQGFIQRGAHRVAVIDVDYHHGNGTQSIFYARDDVQFISLHGDPRTSYPYFSGHRDEHGAAAGVGFRTAPPGTATNSRWRMPAASWWNMLRTPSSCRSVSTPSRTIPSASSSSLATIICASDRCWPASADRPYS